MKVELPEIEELHGWLNKTYSHLNPDVKPFFLLGVQALYMKLGGKKFIQVKD